MTCVCRKSDGSESDVCFGLCSFAHDKWVEWENSLRRREDENTKLEKIEKCLTNIVKDINERFSVYERLFVLFKELLLKSFNAEKTYSIENELNELLEFLNKIKK